MPKTKIYSLHLPFENVITDSKEGKSVTMLISSPRHLAQPFIVYRLSPYQIEISKYSKWESSPVSIVKESFGEALSSVFGEVKASGFVPEGYYSFNLNLRRFERTAEDGNLFGEVVFAVTVRSPEGREIMKRTISKKIVLDGSNDVSLAKGLSAALGEGIQDVMADIKDL
jgi:ABC-type uncharacterized transport system auxiliary subunit